MSPLDRSEGIDLIRSMLVTGLLVSVLATACTPVDVPDTTTTAGTTTSTAPSMPVTSEPGILTGVGIAGENIEIGVLVPRSGPLGVFGESVLMGQIAYWNYVNDVLGGVGGRFDVSVTAFDTAYDAETAEVGFGELRDNVIGIAGALGTPIDEALAPPAVEEGLLMMSGSLSSEWIGHPAIVPNLMLPTYRDQVASGLSWASEAGLAGAVAILFQEGSYGEDCVRGYDRAVDESGLSNAGRIAHAAAATDFGEVVGRLTDSAADLVVVCTTPDALVRIVATAESLDYRPTFLVSAQSFDPGVPVALGGDAGVEAGLVALARTWVLGASPPADSPARQLLDDVFGDDEETNWYSLLGYSQAATFHLILEEALEASDLTRDGLRAAAGRLDALDLGLDGPSSSLVGPVPVSGSAVGAVTAESVAQPFGIQAGEPYFASPFVGS
jgi:ABC-type branched-subunit amino acid transport system substrate-binding protein